MTNTTPQKPGTIAPAPAPARPAWGAPNPAVTRAEATPSAAGGKGGAPSSSSSSRGAAGAALAPAPAAALPGRCDAIKLLQITQAPPVLTLHLKRFTANGRSVAKVNTHVAFPLSLTLLEQPSGLAAARAARPTAAVSAAAAPAEGPSPADADSPNPTEWAQLDPQRATPRRFELFGVVEHSGTYRDGHYTAYVRDGATDGSNAHGATWHLYSDTKVTPVSEAAVLRAQAFLLFYTHATP